MPPACAAFVAIKVFQPSFYAREDTRTPTIKGGISVAVNVVALLALFPFIGHVGIAAATSLAAWVNAAMLVIRLITTALQATRCSCAAWRCSPSPA